jgi:hypothetical protein
MTVLVESGVACIPGTESGAQADYWGSNDAQVTLSITAAHATLPRIDIVVINIRDTFYSGGSNDSQLQVITGTAASSPVAPTAPNNAIILYQVAVGAAVTSIVDANLTDVRFYLAGVGGVINIRNLAAAPVAGTEMFAGQLLYTMDTKRLYLYDGTATNQVYPSTDIFVRKTADETVNNSATLQNDDVLLAAVAANQVYEFELQFHYNSGTTPDIKFGWTFPSGLTMVYDIYSVGGGSFLGYGQTQATVPALDGLGSPIGGLAKGIIAGTYAAGTLQLQWAQNTANASNTIVLAGSYLKLIPRT